MCVETYTRIVGAGTHRHTATVLDQCHWSRGESMVLHLLLRKACTYGPSLHAGGGVAKQTHTLSPVTRFHKAMQSCIRTVLAQHFNVHRPCCRTCLLTHLPVQVLGAKRKNLAGYSSSTVQPHQGFIYGCALIQATPPGVWVGGGLVDVCVCVGGGVHVPYVYVGVGVAVGCGRVWSRRFKLKLPLSCLDPRQGSTCGCALIQATHPSGCRRRHQAINSRCHCHAGG